MFRVTKEARALLADQYDRIVGESHAAAEYVERQDIPAEIKNKIVAFFEMLPDCENGMERITLSSTKEPEFEFVDVSDCSPNDVIFRHEGKPVLAVAKAAAELMEDVTVYVEHTAEESRLAFRGQTDDGRAIAAQCNKSYQS